MRKDFRKETERFYRNNIEKGMTGRQLLELVSFYKRVSENSELLRKDKFPRDLDLRKVKARCEEFYGGNRECELGPDRISYEVKCPEHNLKKRSLYSFKCIADEPFGRFHSKRIKQNTFYPMMWMVETLNFRVGSYTIRFSK